MPVRADPKLRGTLAQNPLGLEPRAPVSLDEQLGAAFDLDNVVVSARNRLSEPDFAADPDFDFRAHLRPEEVLLQHEFASARSLGEMNQVRERVERERRARMYLEEGPLPGLLASSIAVLMDPTTYVPIAGQVGKAAQGAKIAGRMARLGVGAAVEVAGSEAALQATQQTRTATESLAAILMGGAFGTGVGAAVGAVSARQASVAVQNAVDDFVTVAESQFGTSTAGSAQVARMAPEDTELAGGAVTEALARGLGRIKGFAAPSLELATSELPAARQAIQTLVDTGLITKGQAKGLAGPVALETKIRGHEGAIAESFQMIHGQYRDFRDSGGRLSAKEFRQEVGRAMRRGDQSAIPGVSKAAREIREKVFEPYKKAAIEAGLLPEDVGVETALSYFTRVYRRELLRDATMRNDFQNRIVDWFKRTTPDLFENEADMAAAADDIIDTILGSPSGRIPLVGAVAGKRGPLKERTFNIPDEMIEDFLESDVLEVSAYYMRTMAADIETKKALGSLDGDDMAGKIMEDARAQAKEAVDAGKAKEADSLLAEGERQARLVQELLNEIRGVRRGPWDPSYTMARRALKVGRDLNFLRLLGSVLVSSIPDVGRVVMEEGLVRSFGPLVADMMSGFRGLRLGVKEARAAGTALDLINGQRSAALFDVTERNLATSRFEEGLDTATKLFGRLTLLDPWNTALKGWTSMVAGTRILQTVRALERGQKVSKRDMRKLAQSGITEALARRIARQSDNWEEHAGAILPNVLDWTDNQAKQAFRDALLRDVDNTIITPGAGDAPLWTSTEFGRSIFQFKRFASASTQRILLTGMQARDMQTLNGVLIMTALGAAGTAIRDMTFETDDKPLGEVRERSASQWVADAVDRSGVASMFFEMNNMAEKFAGISAVSAVTGREVSRFAGRDLVGQALGPSAGLLQDAGSAVSNALRDDFTRPDLHRLRKLFPGQNLFYLRGLLDRAERETGLPARQPRAKRRRPRRFQNQ